MFAGDSEGNLIAFDARTGKDLWHIQLGAAIYSSPITYSLDGRQYRGDSSGRRAVRFCAGSEIGWHTPSTGSHS